MSQSCVVGIDPGLTRCGIGVVCLQQHSAAIKPVAVDVIRTPIDTDIAASFTGYIGGSIHYS